jgi:lipopolysaccharide transport system permease protein
LNLSEVWQYRDLLGAMTRRDLTLRYRQTMLGPVWIVLQPVIGAGLFSFLFGSVANFKSEGVPYFLFSYAGMVAWNPFSSTLLSATGSLTANINLIGKIYFPRILIPLSLVGSKLLDFTVSIALVFVLAVAYGVDLTPRLLLVPAWLLLAFALALGPGLIAAALNVSYRDIGQIVPSIVPMLLFLCPVAYGESQIPRHLRFVLDVNPLVGMITGFRWALIGRGVPDWSQVAYSVGFAVLLLAVGLGYFRSAESRFADEI